jgi:multidrug efflux pump subunit AcrB
VAIVSFVILLMGSLAVVRMRTDILPTIDIPVVVVAWSYPGLSADDMEQRIVWLSERSYSTTVSGITRIESQSIDGLGILRIYFEPDTDMGSAVAQLSSASLTASRFMPTGIQPPVVLPYNASNVPVAQVTISSATVPEQQLYDLGLNAIRVRLFTVPGLSTPAPYGGKSRQVMIDIDPAAAAARGLSPSSIADAVLASNIIVPAGNLRAGDTEYAVATNSSPETVDEFRRFPLAIGAGPPLLLGDVANVRDGYAVQQNVVRVDGRRAAYLVILRKANASTLAVVEAARALLPSIKSTLPPGVELKLDFDQSAFVRAAVSGVLREAVVASLLVSLLILAFLGSVRSVVIVCTSIPLAILSALVSLFLSGNTLNIMTLGGLALAIGMLVDDATVEVENIHRNLHQGKDLRTAILDGAHQVARPALAATATVCIVFFPVIFLFGPAKHLFTPLALSVVCAMGASYLLSRTLVPVLAHRLMSGASERQGSAITRRIDGWREAAFDGLQRAYGAALWSVLRKRAYFVGCALLVVAGTVLLAGSVGADFFPQVDAGQMRLHVRAPIGTRIEKTEQLVSDVEARIRQVVGPKDLAAINDNIGVPFFVNLAFVRSDNIGPQDAEVLASLRPGHRPTVEYQRRLREELPHAFPGVQFYFQPADIVSQVLDFGVSAPLDVQILGNDLEKTAALARTLRERMRRIPGAVDVRIAQAFDRPTIRVDVDRELAAQAGLTQRDVANSLLVSLSSSALVAPSFWVSPSNRINYLVAVQTPLSKATSLEDLRAIPIARTASSAPGSDEQSAIAEYVGAVSRVRPAVSSPVFSHETVQRVVNVQSGVEGRDLGSVANRVAAAVRELGPLPPGVRVQIRGQSESMLASFKSLGFGLAIAALLVYGVLVILFQSWRDPVIILLAVPAALAGVVWMLATTHTTLNVESLMGAVMAVGVAVSNSILLVSFANDARIEQNLDAFGAILHAAKTRLRPVLMTALAMILGMLPMALGRGEGAEQNAPLGRAVIGGLVVATAATLFFIPIAYTVLRRDRPRALESEATA